jgi:maleylpyruvate isomerase
MVDDIYADGIAAVEVAFDRVLDAVEPLSVEEVRADSRLPGWSRGHILTHLARNADGNRNIVEGALANEERSQYPGGAEQRVSEIEAGAGRAPDVLIRDLTDSQRLLIAAWRQLPTDGWERTGVWLTAGRRNVDAGLQARRRELLVHLVDLDVGVRPDDLPDDFLAEQVDWLMKNRGSDTWPDADWS